jgi:hypothetical protein
MSYSGSEETRQANSRTLNLTEYIIQQVATGRKTLLTLQGLEPV